MKALLIGAAAGAALGALFGWIVGDGADEEGRSGIATLGPGDWIGLSMSMLTLVRQFGQMVKKA